MRKELSSLKDHYIVCGFGRAAKPVADGLAHQRLPFCVIESDATNETNLQDLNYLYLIDDATSDEALEDAGVRTARAVLTLLPSDADNLYVTVTAKALNPGIRVIARAVDERGEVKLRRGGANEVISPYNLASHRILQAATSPTVLQFMKHVADRHYLEMSLVEAKVSEASRLKGLSIGDAHLRADFGVIIVAIRRDEAMLFNPGPQEQLLVGDVLVLMGHEEKLVETERALNG
jgi:voltage-gated potassium channel